MTAVKTHQQETDAYTAEAQKLRASKQHTWIPVNKDDLLTGRLLDVQEAWSDVRNNGQGGWYPLLTIGVSEATGYKVAAGMELKVHGFRSVLGAELARQRPEIGETLTITYQGISDATPQKGKNRAHLYSVRVHERKAGAAAVWAGLAMDAEEKGLAGRIPPSARIKHPPLDSRVPAPAASVLPAGDDDIPFD